MGLALISLPERRPLEPALRDVFALAVLPTLRFIARQPAAIAAAARAYWSAL